MNFTRTLLRCGLMAGLLAPLPGYAQVHGPASHRSQEESQDDLGGLGDFLVSRFAEHDGDLQAAAAYSLRALSESTTNVQVRQAFLDALLAGDKEAADLAGKLPGDPLAALLLADKDAEAGHWDAAARRYAAIPDTRRSLAALLQPLLVAWAHAGEGNTDAALATLHPLESSSHRGVYLLNAAMIADLGDKKQEADRLYREARTAYPALNLRMAHIMASWFSRSGHATEADAILQQLTDTMPQLSVATAGLHGSLSTRPVPDAKAGLAEAYLALGASLRDQNAPELVLMMLQYAIDLRPHFAAALLLKADVESDRHWYDDAIASLDQIETNDPLAPVATLRKAAILQRTGKTDAAITSLQQVIAQLPDNPLPYMQLGDTLREAHRYNDAVNAYNEAVKRVPHPTSVDWSLFYARAIALDGAHDWPKAEADLNLALKLSPDQPAVLNYLAYSWTEKGIDLPNARAMAEKAVAAEPEEGAFVDTLGWVQLRQNEVDPALLTLQRAAEMEPEDPVINGHLADADKKAGHLLDAIYQWQSALRFNPTPDDAASLKTKLKDGLAEFAAQTDKAKAN